MVASGLYGSDRAVWESGLGTWGGKMMRGGNVVAMAAPDLLRVGIDGWSSALGQSIHALASEATTKH